MNVNEKSSTDRDRNRDMNCDGSGCCCCLSSRSSVEVVESFTLEEVTQPVSELIFKVKDNLSKEDIEFVRNQGFELDDENEPAIENIPEEVR